MTCKKCGFINEKGSHFCQECGYKLNVLIKKKAGVYAEIRDEISEVVFQPERRKFPWVKAILVIGGIIVLLFVLLIWIGASESNTDTTNVDSQEVSSVVTSFPLQYLELSNVEAEWINEELYLSGILKNNFDQAVKDVSVRVDFYWDQAQKQLFDTRYVTIIGAAAKGAFSFSEALYAYPVKQFWYTFQIEGASY